MPAVVGVTLVQENDYVKSTEKNVELELVQLMGSMGVAADSGHYIDYDGDEPIESPPDTIERDDVNDEDSEASDCDDPVVPPSVALECCMTLAKFMTRQPEHSVENKAVKTITDFIRQHCIQQKRQITIAQFFEAV